MSSLTLTATENISTDRLLSIYYSATPSQRYDGLTWYTEAREFIKVVAKKFELPTAIVAGVVAVTSPRKGWGANKDIAYQLCEMYTQHATEEDVLSIKGAFRTNLAKAWNILRMTEADNVYDYVRGPKVTAFYANLLGIDSALTLDTHALRAWAGHTDRISWSKKELTQAETDYRNAASRTDVTVAQFQAIIWVVWRERIMSPATVAQYDTSKIAS